MIKVKSFVSKIQLGKQNKASISELNKKFQKVKVSVFSSMSMGYFLIAIIIIAIIIIKSNVTIFQRM